MGALWLGEDGIIGYMPCPGYDEGRWKTIIYEAYAGKTGPAPRADDVFDYWVNAGNGITWEAGPIEHAGSLVELEDMLSKLP